MGDLCKHSASTLKRELTERAATHAAAHGLLHAISDGPAPSIIFGRDEHCLHGNFHSASYRRICANAQWRARLDKVHTSSRRMLVRSDWRWRELDCAHSSDALLMNIFCHPGVLRNGRMDNLLQLEPGQEPIFGYRPRVPLAEGRVDQTEVDMKLGDLLVEAKLTESDFQTASITKLVRYRDIELVFGSVSAMRDKLSTVNSTSVQGYQVIRGILAAFAQNRRFCLICDARRPDLIERWYAVVHQVQDVSLRCRLLLLSWQELAAHLPMNLQQFLGRKYGIIHKQC